LPKSYELKQCGDVQIYSASKAFGLSGIRIGWAVCPNPDYYKLIREYMEAMTVGVSILPQVFTYDLMSHMEQHPYMVEQFEDKAAISLMYAKAAMMKVDSEVLEVPQDLIKTPGMFLFCKIKDYSLLEKAKINAIDGKHFGMPGYVRMNLAFNAGRIDEIVARLNATKGR
jgi:aspartate/methionine/tyrosine aminotransferase